MRTLHIHCDGGFGNRFNGLVAGLLTARLAGLTPLVVWPCNNWCAAPLGRLLQAPPPVIERELAEYVPQRDRFHFCMTEDHLGMGVPNRSPLSFTDPQQALQWLAAAGAEGDVFFHTPLLPPYLPAAQVLAQVRALPLHPGLRERAGRLAAELRLDDQVIGVQIRKTDFGAQGADDRQLHELIERRPGQRFFVCSDDAEVECRFAALPNVVVHAKRAYVEKRVAGGWNTPIVDHSGRHYPFNAHRSADSVEDAVVDLLLLARTRIVRTSHSTFLNTALLLQAAAAAAREVTDATAPPDAASADPHRLLEKA